MVDSLTPHLAESALVDLTALYCACRQDCQFLRGKGLGDHRKRAQCQRVSPEFFTHVRGYQYHRRQSMRWMLLQRLKELKPVHGGHPIICNHKMEPVVVQISDGGCSMISCHAVISP